MINVVASGYTIRELLYEKLICQTLSHPIQANWIL